MLAAVSDPASCLGPLFVRAGDAAHEGRNLLAGYNNASSPVLLCVDTMLAQIEAIGRDLCSLANHKYDLSTQLANAIKCSSCARQNLALIFNPEKHEAPLANSAEKVAALCLVAEQALQEAGARIARATAAKAAADFGLPLEIVQLQIPENHEADKENNNLRDFDADAVSQVKKCTELVERQQPLNFCNGSGTLLELAATGCNVAHGLQTRMAPFTRAVPFDGTATKVIAQAGNIENRFRDIQAQTKAQSKAALTHHDPRALAVNLNKNVVNILTKVRGDVALIMETRMQGQALAETGSLSESQARSLDGLGEAMPNVEAIAKALEKCLEAVTAKP